MEQRRKTKTAKIKNTGVRITAVERMKLPFELKDIKPGAFSYLTRRKLKNAEDKETGEIFLWKKSARRSRAIS